MKTSAHLVLIAAILALAVVVPLIAGCGGDDDDDDDSSGDEEAIRAVVEEMTQGWSERTEQGLIDKVFPHISEDFDYAGLDREGLMDRSLDELEDNKMTIESYVLEQSIAVDGDRASDTTSNSIAFTFTDENLDFDMVGTGVNRGITELVKESDGVWRVTALKTLASSAEACGGDEAYIPQTLEAPGIEPSDSVVAGGSVAISGSMDMPEATEDQVAFAQFGLEWNDRRHNLVYHDNESESVYTYEIEEAKGALDLAVVLPDEGDPAGLEIPGELMPGLDSVTALLSAGVYEIDEEQGEAVLLGGRMIYWVLPLEDFTTGTECEPDPLDDSSPDGVWRIDLEENPYFLYPMLLDMSVVAGEVYASMYWYSDNQEADEDPVFVVAPLEGDLSGSILELSFVTEGEDCPPQDPDLTFSWIATIDGLYLDSGVFDVSGCGIEPSIHLDFLGEKISNRCDYVADPEDIEGEWTLSVAGEPDQDWTFAIDEEASAPWYFDIAGGGTDYYGLLQDNRMFAYDEADPTIPVFLIFHDEESGMLVFHDTGIGGDLTRPE